MLKSVSSSSRIHQTFFENGRLSGEELLALADLLQMSENSFTLQAACLHLLVEGIGLLQIKREFEETAESMLYSGYFFDLAIFNALGVYVGLERSAIM